MIIGNRKKRLVITNEALNVLNQFKQTKNKKEQGGVLLGEVNQNEIRITKISVPTTLDKSKKYSFIRSKISAQIIIDYEFYNSKGKTIYLGEWHTHPENNPCPSNTDINMIKTQYDKNIINEDFLVMLIVGIKSLYIAIYDGKKIERIFNEDL